MDKKITQLPAEVSLQGISNKLIIVSDINGTGALEAAKYIDIRNAAYYEDCEIEFIAGDGVVHVVDFIGDLSEASFKAGYGVLLIDLANPFIIPVDGSAEILQCNAVLPPPQSNKAWASYPMVSFNENFVQGLQISASPGSSWSIFLWNTSGSEIDLSGRSLVVTYHNKYREFNKS